MKKPRVVFPFTEAGLGHIMPLRSIADAFEKKYGGKAEVVRSDFFTETNEKPLMDFEKQMCEFVKDQNKHVSFGFFTTIIMYLFGTGICCHNVMRNYVPGAFKAATRHMDELNADLVVSTHWATNYYAVKCSSKPLTALYCPDAHLNPLFEYKSDLTMLSMLPGYKQAAKKRRRFNKKNLKLVPFCIRPQAFEIPLDKKINREKMGLPQDKFTIVLAEGGYGIGKMQAICEEIIAQDLPVTLIPVCGKNEELYEHFKTLKVGENTTFLPQGFCTTILEYIASADLFLGKSGNIIAEPTFFGVPSIVTKHTTTIERTIAKYYVETVGCALNIFELPDIIAKIKEFMQGGEEYERLRNNALAQHHNYGAEKTADYIFDLLCTRFPDLKGEEQTKKKKRKRRTKKSKQTKDSP